MAAMFEFLTYPLLIILCLTLGLAPFKPPHIVEKIQMLMAGQLTRPVDIFDLLMHATPFILLIAKFIHESRSA